MRRSLALLAILAIASLTPLALAADGLDELGFDRTQVEESLFGALRGWYGAPDVPASVRALPDDAKVAAVKTLGAFARAFAASPEFAKRYDEARKGARPKRGFGLPKLSIDAKAIAGNAARRAADKATGKQPPAGELEKDPNVQLKRRLEAFVAATEDVDYAAATQGSGGYRRFTDEAYEAKPAEWKMCFRAGKAAGEAIRTFAKEWAAEL